MNYPVSGQCGCMEGFLLHIETNGSISCHQEFLQGPCGEGQQYILPDDSQDLEPVCIPTDCEKDETRFFNSCVKVPICDSHDFVKFESETNTSRCENLNQIFITSVRIDLFTGRKTDCEEGYGKGAKGDCVKKINNERNDNVKRKSEVFYGRRRNIRCVCCGIGC